MQSAISLIAELLIGASINQLKRLSSAIFDWAKIACLAPIMTFNEIHDYFKVKEGSVWIPMLYLVFCHLNRNLMSMLYINHKPVITEIWIFFKLACNPNVCQRLNIKNSILSNFRPLFTNTFLNSRTAPK